MRLYWEVARRGFRRYATYRGATIGGLVTNTVFGFLRAYVLIAVYRANPDAGGWDVTDAVTYVWLTQSFLMVVAMWGWNELSDRIRTGNIAVDLARPLDLQLTMLATDMGRAAYHLLARGIAPLVTGAVFFDLRLPGDPLIWLATLVCIGLGAVTSFALRFLVHSSAFWLVDIRGIAMTHALLANLLSGFIIPTVLFPGWLADVARVLPFASMIQFPIEVFLGKHGSFPAGVFAFQAAWILAILGLGRLILARGTRHLVVQGG